jgi:diguanylate cyclase (GGDEF)-like protein/PAS domain S-box-containing protein
MSARLNSGPDLPMEALMGSVDASAGLGAASEHELALQRITRLESELAATRCRLDEAQRVARIGSWEWDIPNNAVIWSDELFRIYGLEPGETEPSYEEFLSRVHPDDREAVDERNRKAFADHQPFEDVKRCTRPDGSVFLMRTQGEVMTDGEGNPLRMIGVCSDVTEEKEAEAIQAELAAIVLSSSDAIIAMSPDGVVRDWNPSAESLFGYSREEMIGASVERLIPPPRRGDNAEKRAQVAGGESIAAFETRWMRKEGSLIDVSLTLSPVLDSDGGLIALAAIARDVTERRRFEEQLTHLANHDPLTGLLNRRRFAEELESRLSLIPRYGGGGSVLMLDLDNFKYVNDGFGHGAGDELLHGISNLLVRVLRSTDVVARLGGDEFAILIPESDADEAMVVAERTIEAIRGHIAQIDGKPVRVTTSIGVAPFSDADMTAAEILDAVDQAMYRAKDAGRDCAVVRSDPGSGEVRSAIGWEPRIREALDASHFELHAQPILSLETDEITQYELLLRMRGPDGLIPPGTFLPVAERHGLIHEIDRFVVSEAIAILARTEGFGLEVNVSARSVDDRQLTNLIGDLLPDHGVDPGRLVLEITETAAISSIDQARRFATALSDLGCRFALDDFGAGFGSFYYLKHIPAAYLKIDGDFIRSPRSGTDDLVTESIVRIARGLDKQTIAEYVEDASALAAVRAHGVDFAQGYHVGRPAPVEQVFGD